MARLIRVECCDDCPHIVVVDMGTRGMRRLGCGLVNDLFWTEEPRPTGCIVIPDWCPLPEEASDE